ncbi:hypothetical protein GLA29479_3816 [Lysobacter antibioticus]|jgi:hypothetical protein|nr:hypothetical protein GLA29479_3816 [Lysobacter antibioticus]
MKGQDEPAPAFPHVRWQIRAGARNPPIGCRGRYGMDDGIG